MLLQTGISERLPYSLSRWTDLPAAKWEWFKEQLAQGEMVGIDPRTAVPSRWSLKREDTLGLVFWTKDPENLIRDAHLLKGYPLVVHMTLTGWGEVEKGAPDIVEGLKLMASAVETFGADNVTWRFSPVPAVPDVVDRFAVIAEGASKAGLKEVYLAFLQENDLLPETRPRRSREELLKQMAVRSSGLKLVLCNEDNSLRVDGRVSEGHLPNLSYGICESGRRFEKPHPFAGFGSPREGCGCALAVDPFTINESCTMGCTYCYAADKSLATKKRNTTKHYLPLAKA